MKVQERSATNVENSRPPFLDVGKGADRAEHVGDAAKIL